MTLRRPTEHASPAQREAFKRAFVAEYERLGIGPGDEFVIALPAGDLPLDDPSATKLGGFSRESETSRQAALDNYPRSGKQRERVLLLVARASQQRGVTSEEIARANPDLPLYSVKPRLTELREGGWVRKHGTRPSKSNSPVDAYVLTDKARRSGRLAATGVIAPTPRATVNPDTLFGPGPRA